MRWERGEKHVIFGGEAGNLVPKVVKAALTILGGNGSATPTIADGARFRCSRGSLRIMAGACQVDPYAGGVHWWQGVRAEGVPGLVFELMVEDIIWSHTEVSVELRAEDERLQKDLRKAIAPIIRSALLHGKGS